jgi:acetyl esterase/lipase
MDGLPGEWVDGPWANTDRVVLFLHGGAFVMGSPASHRELAARISAVGGARVLSPDFRLAPEHAFPAALEDTKWAYRWLLDQGNTPSRIAIGGESSGGGLALQALLSMKQERMDLPGAALFLSPVTDWIALDGESYSTRAAVDPLLSPSQCRHTASLYAGQAAEEEPLLQPTRLDLSGLPPMWIQVGDHEVLLSDAERLARRAGEAGVEVDFRVWPGMWHVFQATARFVPEARASIEELGRFLRNKIPVRE